ncbi:MAG: (2Fe-2S)-binding protein [Planctomycetota bacterium]
MLGRRAQAQDAEGALPKKPQEAGISTLGPDAVEVKFTLNGKPTTLSVEPRVTLLDALRDRIGATGTKRVCDRGSCGACTVWLDGATVNACLLLAVDVAGAEVTTIEGIGSDEKLAPIQEAFVACDAMQCGFCTSSMLMSCAALLRREAPGPSSRPSTPWSGTSAVAHLPHVFQAAGGLHRATRSCARASRGPSSRSRPRSRGRARSPGTSTPLAVGQGRPRIDVWAKVKRQGALQLRRSRTRSTAGSWARPTPGRGPG